jgi:hypothetical protein
MARHFELDRALSTSPVAGVDRVVRAWFVPHEPSVAGAVVVDFKSYLERGAATRTPRTSP